MRVDVLRMAEAAEKWANIASLRAMEDDLPRAEVALRIADIYVRLALTVPCAERIAKLGRN